VGLGNTFAFADDLLLCCSSQLVAARAVKIIKQWSYKFKITLNEKKSAILPLALRKKKKMTLAKVY